MTAKLFSTSRRAYESMRLVLWITLSVVLGSNESSAFRAATDYFKEPAIRFALVNPSGEYILTEKNAKATEISVRHIETKTTAVAERFWGRLDRIDWVDDDTIILRHHTALDTYELVIDVSFDDGRFEFETRYIRVPGYVIDALPDQQDMVLWAHSREKENVVYRAPLSKLIGAEISEGVSWAGLKDEFIVARRGGIAAWWITDRDGIVRGGLALYEGEKWEVALWYRENRRTKWRELYRTSDLDEMITPIGMAPDNRNLLVLSNDGLDTNALVEFNVDSAELGEVLFSHPSADLLDIVYDFNGMEILAAVYEEAGLRKYHHFDRFTNRFQRSLEHIFPGQSVAITSTSRDLRELSILVSSPRNPGKFYILNTETKTAVFLGRSMPWLDPEELADVRAIEVTSGGGITIEAFLTVPAEFDRTRKPPPLLVLPHGGPLGVRDNRIFDPLIQHIASGGIAVLQVNFRGSGGYGKAFLEAGFREFSKGIEDDIDAAVDLVVSKGWVDGERMCIAGMSYGGYSAIASTIRKPDQYLCAATIAGVSDVPLFLNAVSFTESEEDRKEIARLIGDPADEYDYLKSISPAYHADKIGVPILIVHGTRDYRVDIEHAYRLRTMLEVHGKIVDWHPMEDAGHSPDSKQMVEMAETLSTFIGKHLRPATRQSDPPRGSIP